MTAEASQVNLRAPKQSRSASTSARRPSRRSVVDPITQGDPLERLPAPPDQAARVRARVPGAHRRRVPEPRQRARSAPSSPARAARRSARTSARSSCRRSTRSRWRSRRCTPTSARVCELGGQDAKIIIFKKNEETGDKTAITSMNDKCASGTGATIDKCVIKVGLPNEEVVKIGFDDSKLHHVAAKCGVFAETDIVNLVKSGIPSHRDHELARRRDRHAEPVGADARQHAAPQGAAARRAEHVPAVPPRLLAQAHPRDLARSRLRVPEGRADRGADHRPRERAVLRRVRRGDVRPVRGRRASACTRGLDGAQGVHHTTAASRELGETAGPAAASAGRGQGELDEFTRSSTRSRSSRDATFEPGQVVSRRHRHGRRLDVVEGRAHRLRHRRAPQEGVHALEGQPDRRTRRRSSRGLKKCVTDQGATLEVMGFGATGYAADVLKESVEVRREHRRDRRAHDVGEALLRRRRRHLRHRRAGHQGPVHAERRHQELPPVEPVLGRQRHAAAGDGRSVRRQGAPSTPTSRSRPSCRPKFSYGCAVFLDSDRVNFQKEGFSKEELLAGPRAGAAEERLAVRRADPAHGGARHASSCSRAARSTTSPRSRRRSTTSRSASRTPRSTSTRTPARPARSAPRWRRCRVVMRRGTTRRSSASTAAINIEFHGGQRRVDALPLLPEQLRAHVHRHQDARRPDRRATSRASPARRAPSRPRRR